MVDLGGEAVRRVRVGEGTRSALLRAAADLLDEGGIEAVTLRAVGRVAGVSRQAPYRHFADKEDLLSAVAAGYFGGLWGEMAAAAEEADGDPMSRLGAMVEAYVRFALRNPNRYRLMLGPEIKGSPHTGVHEAARAVHGGFVGAVAECQKAGQLPAGDTLELAALMAATSHGAVDQTLAGHVEAKKGQGDPLALVRLLLSHLRSSATARRS